MGAVARLFVFGACLTVATVSSAFAQQRGSILGRIVDPDGLPLPGATVTVTQSATGFTRATVTADNGAYSVPNLEPGTYAVSVEMPGFAELRRTDLLLTAGLWTPPCRSGRSRDRDLADPDIWPRPLGVPMAGTIGGALAMLGPWPLFSRRSVLRMEAHPPTAAEK